MKQSTGGVTLTTWGSIALKLLDSGVFVILHAGQPLLQTADKGRATAAFWAACDFD